MSCECTNTGLDIFTVPPIQTSVESGCWVEFYPLATLSDSGPIEFVVKGDSEHYLDLSNSYIHAQIKVVKSDNSNLLDTDPIAPVNLILHSLFSSVDISLNGTLITSSTNTYPYRAYLETLLNYGNDAKSSQLNNAGYYNEGGPFYDYANSAKAPEGFKQRAKNIKSSRTLDLIGKIHADLFSQSKYLLNGIDMRLKFTRSKDAFSLLVKAPADGEVDNYKIKMLHMSLFVRKAALNPAIVLAHGKGLMHSTAKYPIKRVMTKIYSISSGVSNFIKDNLYLSKKPQRLLIGFVSSKAFNGDYHSDPFQFKHYDINSLALYSEGHQIPSKALKPDFENKNYARSYLTLFMGSGYAFKDSGIDISYEDYMNGCTLFCFDLSPSLIDGHVAEPIKSGNLRLEVTFSKALPEPVHVIVYGEQDGLVEIDKARQVISDFSA